MTALFILLAASLVFSVGTFVLSLLAYLRPAGRGEGEDSNGAPAPMPRGRSHRTIKTDESEKQRTENERALLLGESVPLYDSANQFRGDARDFDYPQYDY